MLIRHPRIFGRTAQHREGEPTVRREPAHHVGKGGWRILEEHNAEARDQPLIEHSRRSSSRHISNLEGDGMILGSFTAASEFDQGLRNIETVNGASRRGQSQNLQRRRATASDVGDPAGRFEIQRSDQRFIDRGEHRFQVSRLGVPFIAARVGPAGRRGVLVHE